MMVDFKFIAQQPEAKSISLVVAPGALDRYDAVIAKAFALCSGRSLRADAASLLTASFRRVESTRLIEIKQKAENAGEPVEMLILKAIRATRWSVIPQTPILDTNPMGWEWLPTISNIITPGEITRRDAVINRAWCYAHSLSMRWDFARLLDQAMKRNRDARVAAIEFEANTNNMTIEEYIRQAVSTR